MPAQANLVFNLLPEPGTPQFAIDAFQRAADRWSAVLSDPVTINVEIGFTALGNFILGQAGSEFVEFSYATTRTALSARQTSADDYSSVANLPAGASFTRLINRTTDHPAGSGSATPYLATMDRIGLTTANAKVLGLLGPTTTRDATIRFNSNFGFDFDPDDGIGAGLFDFVGAATHELGHALGFVSGVDDLDYYAGLLANDAYSSNLLDLFRYSTTSIGFGLGITDYTADNRPKYFSVDGGLTSLADFATGVTYGDGRQASHWKDFLNLGMMDPTASPGEQLNITLNDLRAFDVLGYTLVPEPAASTLFLVSLSLIGWRRWRRG